MIRAQRQSTYEQRLQNWFLDRLHKREKQKEQPEQELNRNLLSDLMNHPKLLSIQSEWSLFKQDTIGKQEKCIHQLKIQISENK